MNTLRGLIQITSCSVFALGLIGCAETAMFYPDSQASAETNIGTQQNATIESTQDEVDSLEQAQQYFMDDKFDLAYKALLPLAAEGSADAQYGVGYLSYYGRGTQQDQPAGIEWFKKSAAQGFPSAVEALELLNLNPTKTHQQSENYSPQLDKNIVAETDTSLVDTRSNHPADQIVDAFENVDDFSQKAPVEGIAEVSTIEPQAAATQNEKVQATQTLTLSQAVQQIADVADNKMAAKEQTYGPVKQTDTLWSIANRVRSDKSVTVQQMMMALLRHNPQAFLDNNVNGLMRGVTLTIPTASTIAEYDKQKSLVELIAQEDSWKK